MVGFQKSVNVTQAPGVEGDFASSNPRHSLPSQPGGWISAAAGLTIGRFAWSDTTGTILSNTGTGAPTAFIHRAQQATIQIFLAETSMVILGGQAVGEAFSSGDFFAKNAGGSCTRGMKAFANNTDGSVTFAAAGATVSGSTETRWYCWTTAAAGELVKISTTPLS